MIICSYFVQAAVISLGLIGAGTNNARIAGMLRNLSSYYYKDANLLFCVIFNLYMWIEVRLFSMGICKTLINFLLPVFQVRIAQGLVHLGKGLLTLNPFHSDRFLLSP